MKSRIVMGLLVLMMAFAPIGVSDGPIGGVNHINPNDSCGSC